MLKFTQKVGKENAIEIFNQERLKQYFQDNQTSFGTRVLVYEGGRNATGCGILETFEIYKDDLAEKTLLGLKADKNYVPEFGSEEAKNFAIFQNRMLKLRAWKEPKISPVLLLGKETDLDGDGIADLAGKDGKIIYSSTIAKTKSERMGHIMQLIDANGDGKISKEELRSFFSSITDPEKISEFVGSMDLNGDGRTTITEVMQFICSFLGK